MNIIICWFCGVENEAEEEEMNNDELTCRTCGELLFEEEDRAPTIKQWAEIDEVLKRTMRAGRTVRVYNNCTRVFSNIWQCNDCGATAEGGSQLIKHHATCRPGESKRWEKHYAKANDEEAIHELRMARWLQGKPIMLLQSDIDILDGSRNRTVRTDQMEDLQVKVLYDIWNSL